MLVIGEDGFRQVREADARRQRLHFEWAASWLHWRKADPSGQQLGNGSGFRADLSLDHGAAGNEFHRRKLWPPHEVLRATAGRKEELVAQEPEIPPRQEFPFSGHHQDDRRPAAVPGNVLYTLLCPGEAAVPKGRGPTAPPGDKDNQRYWGGVSPDAPGSG